MTITAWLKDLRDRISEGEYDFIATTKDPRYNPEVHIQMLNWLVISGN